MDWNNLIENKYFQIIIIILIALITDKISGKTIAIVNKNKTKKIQYSFIKNTIKTLIWLAAIVKIGSFFDTINDLYKTILMSSSLLVAVFGFIIQEGITNIVHGCILIWSKPFNVGDRLEIHVNSEIITGIVKSINLRHTTLLTTIDNAPLIIPNSQLDMSTFKNFSNGEDVNKYRISVNITLEDASNAIKRNVAKEIISKNILSNPHTIDNRENKDEPIFVKVDLLESYVKLTAFIEAKSFDENLIACTEITEQILDDFKKYNIKLAYPHIEVIKNNY